MEIQENDKVYIITPLSPKIDEHESTKLFSNADFSKNFALDLSYVSDCTIEFIEMIKKVSSQKKIGIFNIHSDLFALFNFMNLDKYANLFVSELDFEANSHRLVKRNFQIV